MIKKSLLILISLFVFMSCSKPVTSPNNNSEVLPPLTEGELIAKYGIDINQDNAVIKQQIKEKLQAYFQEKGSYRVIFTGIPKVGKYDYLNNNSPYAVLIDSVIELGLKDVTIDVDIRNINFIDGFLERGIFSSDDKPNNTGLVFNFIFPENKITTIEQFAFSRCYCIEELVIPDSVITIEGYTFFNSPYLKKVTFGKGLKTIEAYLAFANCKSLEEVILNE